MISSLAYVAAFLLAGLLFMAFVLTLAKWIRPDRPSEEKLTTYESGEAPVGNANIRFNPRFYLYALLFILFEIELVLLFPWAVTFGDSSINEASSAWKSYALIEMLLFIGILALGLAFAWVKGYLQWEKSMPKEEAFKSPIPEEQYKRFT